MRLGPDDYDAAARVLLAPPVAEHLTRMTPEKIVALLAHPGVYVLAPEPDCVFIAHPFIGTALLVHQAALPEARGKRVLEAGKRAVAWMFEHTAATCFVGVTPLENRPALTMAGLIGFERIGVLRQAYSGDDAVITAITRATPERGPDGGRG